jgi:hypothetical protein
MRGHHPIIAMRRKHVCPSLVLIDTDIDHLRCWRDWPAFDPSIAQVHIDADDIPSLLDLRWLVGITVIVSGSNPERVAAIDQACRDHQAKRVIAAVCDPTKPVSAMRVTDTEQEANHG